MLRTIEIKPKKKESLVDKILQRIFVNNGSEKTEDQLLREYWRGKIFPEKDLTLLEEMKRKGFMHTTFKIISKKEYTYPIPFAKTTEKGKKYYYSIYSLLG